MHSDGRVHKHVAPGGKRALLLSVTSGLTLSYQRTITCCGHQAPSPHPRGMGPQAEMGGRPGRPQQQLPRPTTEPAELRSLPACTPATCAPGACSEDPQQGRVLIQSLAAVSTHSPLLSPVSSEVMRSRPWEKVRCWERRIPGFGAAVLSSVEDCVYTT